MGKTSPPKIQERPVKRSILQNKRLVDGHIDRFCKRMTVDDLLEQWNEYNVNQTAKRLKRAQISDYQQQKNECIIDVVE